MDLGRRVPADDQGEEAGGGKGEGFEGPTVQSKGTVKQEVELYKMVERFR